MQVYWWLRLSWGLLIYIISSSISFLQELLCSGVILGAAKKVDNNPRFDCWWVNVCKEKEGPTVDLKGCLMRRLIPLQILPERKMCWTAGSCKKRERSEQLTVEIHNEKILVFALDIHNATSTTHSVYTTTHYSKRFTCC